VHPGEVVDPSKPEGSIIIVSIDPLWVEFYLPARQAQLLKAGDELKVSYDQKTWVGGKLIYISPVAETGTDLLRLRLELPNPGNKSAGQQVSVQLPAEVVAAGEPSGSASAAVETKPAGTR
jgi:multidrug efflux pump subunit AcrA (membrane-fusion protein)